MILDVLTEAGRYTSLHPAFARAFAFLASTDLASLPEGRTDIDGDRLFVILDRKDGRGHDAARLEAHRRYIDIQLTLSGAEEIGWTPLASCTAPDGTFDDSKDVGFFIGTPSTWLRVAPGSFAIFFPQDAHAPLGGRGALVKAMVMSGCVSPPLSVASVRDVMVGPTASGGTFWSGAFRS
jgi:YhcH/YjgK/YiaL family protein